MAGINKYNELILLKRRVCKAILAKPFPSRTRRSLKNPFADEDVAIVALHFSNAAAPRRAAGQPQTGVSYLS